MMHLPPSLLTVLFLFLALPLPSPVLSYASPQPALVSDAYMHLMPRNTLFFRQVSGSSDLQTFTKALGGFPAPPITNSGDEKRPFKVEDSTFTDFESAGQRSCDEQFQLCSQAANEEAKGEFSVGDCDGQKDECRDVQKNAQVQDFEGATVASENIGPDPEFPDFDLICEA